MSQLSAPLLYGLDIIDIAGAFVIFSGIFICVPIIAYYLHKFKKYYSNASTMKYRNKWLVYTINILTIFILTIEKPYLCIVCVLNLYNDILPIWSYLLGTALSFWSIFILFFIKIYLLFFEQRYHLSMINITWKKQINPGIQDWYIKQRMNGYGNFKFLLKISFIVLSIVVVIETFGINYFAENIIFNIIHLSLIIMPFILSFIIFCKTKSFNDIYQIRKEILYQIIIISFFIAFHVLFVVLYSFIFIQLFDINHGHHNNHNHNISFSKHTDFNIFVRTPNDNEYDMKYNNIIRLKWLLYTAITQYLLLFIALLSTAYPIAIHKKLILQNIMNRSRRNSAPITSLSPSSNMREMALTISHTKGFKLFMQHLVHEFSTENLLFLTELIQIKYSFQRKNHNLIKVPRQFSYDNDNVSPPPNTMQLLLTKQSTIPSRISMPSLPDINSNDTANDTDIINTECANPELPQDSNIKTKLEINVELHRLEMKEDDEESVSMKLDQIVIDDDDDDDNDNNKYMVIDINAANHNLFASRAKSLSKSRTFGNIFKFTNPTNSANSTKSASIDDNKTNKRISVASRSAKSATTNPQTPRTPRTPMFSSLQYNKSTSTGWETSKSSKTSNKESIDSYIFHNDGTIYIRIELPAKLPMSTILNDYQSLSDQMTALYHKYICVGSMYEINISYDSRKRLKDFFEIKLKNNSNNNSDNNDDDESLIFNVLDETAKEILMLMIDSFRRFQVSDIYQSFYNKYKLRRNNSNNNIKDEIVSDTDTTCIELPIHDHSLPVLRNMTSYDKLCKEYGNNNNQ